MKKLLNGFLALSLIVSSLTFSRPSQAAVGGLLLSAPVALTGLALAGGGWIYTTTRRGHWSETLGQEFLGVIVTLAGLVVLEGENEVSFQTLSTKEAKKMGLSSIEHSSFNADIDQVNAVLRMVTEDLSQLEKATPAASAQAWESAKLYLGPETFSAMVKITSQLAK